MPHESFVQKQTLAPLKVVTNSFEWMRGASQEARGIRKRDIFNQNSSEGPKMSLIAGKTVAPKANIFSVLNFRLKQHNNDDGRTTGQRATSSSASVIPTRYKVQYCFSRCARKENLPIKSWLLYWVTCWITFWREILFQTTNKAWRHNWRFLNFTV